MKHPAAAVGPHGWTPRRWRRWICCHCYAPRSLHPRTGWALARPRYNHQYLSRNAPHFDEGW